jgi:hypothetical protein
MKRTASNISLLGAFLRCFLELPATYVGDWDAFYVKEKAIYIKLDLVEEAYNEHCRKLLKIK